MRVQPDTMPGSLAETTRCYPRDLRSAFPDSEDSRSGIEQVAESTWVQTVYRAAEWAVGLALFVWLFWAALRHPSL